MAAPVKRTAPVAGTLAEHIAELGDPVVFVRRRIHWTLSSTPTGWHPDLIDAALETFVDACLAWRDDGSYELGAYVTLRIQSALPKQLRRIDAQRAELGRQACVSDLDWLTYRSGAEAFDRATDRLDLQRWADLAQLSPTMRWGVEAYALLGSPKDRGRWYDAARAGLRYMKTAAADNRRRDDHWTRARAGRDGEDYAELRRLYLDEGLTLKEIADRLGMGSPTVARRLRAGGTQLRKPGERPPASPARRSGDV